MFTLHHISYSHPNGDLLFDQLDLSILQKEKAALVGNNGAGKSTLLHIIATELLPTSGQVMLPVESYLVPQIFGQFDHLTIAEALKVDRKLKGLQAILNGDGAEENFSLLQDDWTIQERCEQALSAWELHGIDLELKLSAMSGGQKAKVFLAGIAIHQPGLILMDEPSNHLDRSARNMLYKLIENSPATLLIVSHDRKLLNLLDKTYELSPEGIRTYGGNYDFYASQKQLEQQALVYDLENRQKELRKAKEVERESVERQQKLDARGKKKQDKSGVSRIMMNTLRNSAENSSAKTKAVHADKISGIAAELHHLRMTLSDKGELKIGFNSSSLHHGKVLFKVDGLNHGYEGQMVWKEGLDFQITSGERISIEGKNGSGKTTLLKIILGLLLPIQGKVTQSIGSAVYIDQEYSLIDNSLTVYDQARSFNSGLVEHEIKIRLDRFLFDKNTWDKSCSSLSGGEKMRLLLCCLIIRQTAPELIVLDEPTNNLDMQSIAVLTQAVTNYDGTLIVVSHDERFITEVGCDRIVTL